MGKVMSIKSVKETTLFKELVRRKNTEFESFISNIPDLCDEASDRAKQIVSFFPEYTLHDQTHFLRVTELMSYILGEQINNLSEIEIGLLILSAFYHDQGMLVTEQEYSSLSESEEYTFFCDNWRVEHPNYKEIENQIESSYTSSTENTRLRKAISELDAAMLTDYLRVTHGKRSFDYVNDTFSNERVLNVGGTNISHLLAILCLSHTKSVDWVNSKNGFNYDENVGSFNVNMVFLTLILRLADILDFDSDRTPDVLFKSIHFTNSVSVSEWKKHRQVNGWEISDKIIRFSMLFEHPVYEKTANVFLDWIDKELAGCHNSIDSFPAAFHNYKIMIPDKVDRTRIGAFSNLYIYHDLEFSFSRDEIVKLLLTDNLYRRKSLFIRELLQNSLDALRLRKAVTKKDGFDWSFGKVQFRHYIDLNGEEVIECQDNGCGMDEEIIINYFGRIGRSYYRSPEFKRLNEGLKEEGLDFEPCSQFGIGFMSCFMIGDRIQILTRKDYGHGRELGKPLEVDINGLGSLIVVREGLKNQCVGTTVRVFCRDKTQYFDKISDRIRLVANLKALAIGNEFPIEGRCDIDGVKNCVEIPTSIDYKETFIESLEITNQKTFELDLSTVNKNLTGSLRQTFLLDENDFPCIENNEATWEISTGKSKNWKNTIENLLVIRIKETDKIFRKELVSIEGNTSISLDGILVCGKAGRKEFLNDGELIFLGSISSSITSCCPCSIDVRGDIKPELNPAREPLRSSNSLTEVNNWTRLQSLINRGNGIIWEQVLRLCTKGLSSITFWKLILIYKGDLRYIKSKLLIECLELPFGDNSWICLSDIAAFVIKENMLFLESKKGESRALEFPSGITQWGKVRVNKIDFTYWISHLLISLSKFEINKNGFSRYVIQHYHLNNHDLPSHYLIHRELRTVRAIPFLGVSCNCILYVKHSNNVNLECPLVRLALKSKHLKERNEIQDFAFLFVFNLSYFVNKLEEEGKEFNTKYCSRPLRYAATLYLNIDWNKYDEIYRPPYNILLDSKTQDFVEITSDTFMNWVNRRQDV